MTSSNEPIRVTTWFSGAGQHHNVEVRRDELPNYLGSLRVLKRYSESLRAAVDESEVDLGPATRIW